MKSNDIELFSLRNILFYYLSCDADDHSDEMYDEKIYIDFNGNLEEAYIAKDNKGRYVVVPKCDIQSDGKVSYAEFLRFTYTNNLIITVTERSKPYRTGQKFYCQIKKCEYRDGKNDIKGYFGNGDTADEAIKDLCIYISNKILVVFPFTQKSKDIQLPQLKHSLNLDDFNHVEYER